MPQDEADKTPHQRFVESLAALRRELNPSIWLSSASAALKSFFADARLTEGFDARVSSRNDEVVKLEIRDPRYSRDDGVSATYLVTLPRSKTSVVRFVGERPTTPGQKPEEAHFTTEAEFYDHLLQQVRKTLGLDVEPERQILILPDLP